MSISIDVDIADGVYTPFFQDVRGGPDGKSPVGTVSVEAVDIGESGGGTVTQNFFMQRIMFGFRAILAPTLITAEDDLATAEAIRLVWRITNRRLVQSMTQAALAIAGAGGNFAKFDESGLILESDVVASQNFLAFTWSTNTLAKVYRSFLFASVFDAEVIEAQGSISDFLAGVR